MTKKIGIIFDEIHPLIEVIKKTVEESGFACNYIHWSKIRTLWPQGGLKNNLNQYCALYLDRMGETTNSYQTQINFLNYLTDTTVVVNRPHSYWLARNKALSDLEFSKHGIPHPSTIVCYSMEEVLSSIASGPLDLIVKSYLGYCAKEVMPFSKEAPPIDFIRAILDRDQIIILQQFIENKEKFIWRVDVVDKKIVVLNKRYQYNQGPYPICNGTQGGEIIFFPPEFVPNSIHQLVQDVINIFQLDVAGLDILISPDGKPLILEVNPEPDITLDRYEFPQAIANLLIMKAENK